MIADLRLQLRYKEHSTQPREGARTYRLVLQGEPPEDFNLLPGMAMRVSLERPPGHRRTMTASACRYRHCRPTATANTSSGRPTMAAPGAIRFSCSKSMAIRR